MLLPVMPMPAMNQGNPRKPRKLWSKDEDKRLCQEVAKQVENGELKDWRSIAQKLPERTNRDCRKRWIKLDGPLNKGPWNKEEDDRLQNAVRDHSTAWTEVSRVVGTRNADQCAKRWQHFLNPELNHGEWTPREDEVLMTEVEKNGRNWRSIVDSVLHGRSATDAKNRYTILQRSKAKQNKHRAPSLDSGLGEDTSWIMPTDGELDHLDHMLKSNDTGEEISSGILGSMDEELPLTMFDQSHTQIPQALTDIGGQSLSNCPPAMFPNWNNDSSMLNLFSSSSAPQSLTYSSALSNGIDTESCYKFPSPLLNQYRLMRSENEDLRQRSLSDHKTAPEPCISKRRSRKVVEDNTEDEENEDESDEDEEEDEDEDDDMKEMSKHYKEEASHPASSRQESRQQKVTMELRQVEADQVNDILAFVLSSSCNIEVKITRSK